jgi:L-2,4-diaminobutyrate decarboxylase
MTDSAHAPGGLRAVPAVDHAAQEAAEALRGSGHWLVDRMADYLAGVARLPVSTPRPPREVAASFAEPIPRAGRDPAAVWAESWDRVVGDAIHLAHPMYMGHQVAPPLPHAVLADALASLLNQSVAVREMSPTGTHVEGQVVRWLLDLLGFPPTADGTLVSGGSAANLTALLAAREARFPGSWETGIAGTPGADRAVLLVGEHAHYSIERAAGVMGLGSGAVVAVATRDGRMDVAALDAELKRLRREGRVPLAVVATAASTATGQIDPLPEIAALARAAGAWLHVDAAHGASLLLSARLSGRVSGIELADSVAWDPHKLMFMPISAGVVLVRDRRHLDAAFRQSAPYLFRLRPGEERSPDRGQRTLQCSRRLDALKLWISLRLYGADHLAALIEKTVRNTETLHTMLADAPDFEPLHAPETNILCFRYLPAEARVFGAPRIDRLQSELRERYNLSGRGWITATVLAGRAVLRVTLMNPHTGPEQLERLLDGLRELGRGLVAGMADPAGRSLASEGPADP